MIRVNVFNEIIIDDHDQAVIKQMASWEYRNTTDYSTMSIRLQKRPGSISAHPQQFDTFKACMPVIYGSWYTCRRLSKNDKTTGQATYQ